MRGPLYIPADVLGDIPENRPRHEPTSDEIEMMTQVFRESNNLERMDISRRWWDKVGKTSEPVPVLMSEDTYLLDGALSCEQEPWWVQIGAS